MLVQRLPDGSFTIQPTETKTEPLAWARLLNDFLSVISSEEGTNFYRFERIQEDAAS